MFLALKELELHDTMVAAAAPAYQPAHMFGGLGYTQEIVDLEVTAGMEITLPNCDGTQNMYRGPVRISMPVSPGMPLPIAPPIGYQVYMRLDTDPNTGHMIKVYSVLPGPQYQECASRINTISGFNGSPVLRGKSILPQHILCEFLFL